MYTWDFISAVVRDEYDALPTRVGFAFLDVMNALVFNPWEFARRPGEAVDKERSHRTIPFGTAGLLSFLIYEAERAVYVTKIQCCE